MKLLAKETVSIREALQKIDETGEKTLIVVDNKNRLLGTISDGDIRRAILKENNLQKSIKTIYNKQCTYVQSPYKLEAIKKLILVKKITAIPVIDSKKVVVEVLLSNNLFRYKPHRYKPATPSPSVVIMAGGQGTRLHPFTQVLPKPLIPIDNKTAIEVIMNEFCKFGIRDFYISLNYKSEIIQSYLNSLNLDYNITYILEEKYLGTGGSLRLLPSEISDNFIVSNCDTFIKINFNDVYNYHITNKNDITVVGSVQRIRIPYGVLKINSKGLLKEIVEKPEYDFIINTGLYIVKKSTIRYITKTPFHLTDLIKILLEKNKKVGIFPISENSYLDVGQWDKYHKNITFLQEQGQ